VDDLQEQGGIITTKDLNEYRYYSAIIYSESIYSIYLLLRATWDPPLQTNLSDGTKLFTTGLPGSGALLSFILNVFEDYGFTSASISDLNATTLTYHRMIETFKYAYASRTGLGDSAYVDMAEVSATRDQ